mgnify:CR=1 FL=1
MPSRIDQNLIPPVIRESVDPEILNRARSIEWSIDRDTGDNEHGFLDGSNEDYLSSQNYLHKSHATQLPPMGRKSRKVEWSDNGGRDSGFERTPTSPSLYNGKQNLSHRSVSSLSTTDNQQVDLTPLDESLDFGATNITRTTGSMKRHPQGLHPYPIYKVNQEQLEGDVVFEVAPRAKPGERTVHYEKTSRVMNEQELNALGLDPKFFGPNSHTMVDEQEEEMVETSVVKDGPREFENMYRSMKTDASDYFDRQRARSVSPTGNRVPIEDEQRELKKTVIFGSVDGIDREQEFYPYRDAHQGKVMYNHRQTKIHRASVHFPL